MRRLFILVMFLLISSLSVAQTEPAYSNSFGIEAARQAGLVKTLDVSQTIKGVTVFIHWVYIDANEMSIRYYVDAQDMRVSRNVLEGDVRVTDADGNSFFCQGGGLSSSPDPSAPITARSLEKPCPVNSPLLDSIKGAWREIPLTLEFNVNGYGIPDPNASPEGTPEAAPPDIFRFDVNVPYYPAIEVEPDQTITKNGTSVTLKSLSIIPASTVMTICYGLPPDTDWHMGNPSLTIGGAPLRTTMLLEGMWIRNGCQELKNDIYFDGRVPVFTLAFDYLQTHGIRLFPKDRATWDTLLPQLEARGITVILAENPDKTVYPNEMRFLAEDYRDTLYELGLQDRVEGPWKFVVRIPVDEGQNG
jgi:hypothetical protein